MNLNPKELRIGNIVCFGSASIINPIYMTINIGQEIDLAVNSGKYNPASLSEEWLLRFGV